jgi:hypothetical protein
MKPYAKEGTEYESGRRARLDRETSLLRGEISRKKRKEEMDRLGMRKPAEPLLIYTQGDMMR